MRAVASQAASTVSRYTITARQLSQHSPTKPITPDFTTTVNVANTRLSKPKPSRAWSGLKDLKQRTTGSLIPDVLAAMETDEEFQDNARRIREHGTKALTIEEKKRRRRALNDLGLPEFAVKVKQAGVSLTRKPTAILQLNIGLYCNQACIHCHVESSPRRKEAMSREVAKHCIKVLKNSPETKVLDITGGAPELNPEFKFLVEAASELGVEIIDRCNLTVLEEPGQEELASFLAKHKVRVVASLPCYAPKNVNQQRGKGVFDRSIAGLLQLNALGYGMPESGLVVDLVYNPVGPFLPPPQAKLRDKYKEELLEAFGIHFNDLFTITNMPIKRFADLLYRRGELKEYMDLLVRNFNPAAALGIMCRDTVSVGWDGSLYDCDFNQQLGLGLTVPSQGSILDIASLSELAPTPIAFDDHCFGCTAGAGSSCQGATHSATL
eukprot:g19944.t1